MLSSLEICRLAAEKRCGMFGQLLLRRSRALVLAGSRSKWTTSVAPPLAPTLGGKLMDIIHRLFVLGLFGSTVYVGAFIVSAGGELREKKRQARLNAEAEAAAATE